mgnify:FL=1
MAESAIVITGIGAQSAAGSGVDSLATALRLGTPLVSLTDPEDGLPVETGLRARLPGTLADAISQVGLDAAMAQVVRRVSARDPRYVGFSLLSVVEAAKEAHLDEVADRRRIAVIVAGDGMTLEAAHTMAKKHADSPLRVRPTYAHRMWATDLLGLVSDVVKTQGEGVVVSGASASGNLGIMTATRLLNDGAADVCLVVATMNELTDVEVMGFHALGTLARVASPAATSCRPFDVAHSGLVLGEGAATLILERRAHAEHRGRRALATVLSGASALHCTRQTQPSPEAERYVMQEALRRAGLDPGTVDLVSTHGTGTPAGDEAEAEAIRDVFDGEGPWIAATKAVLGHCLGAASALAAVACVLQIQEQTVFPSANLTQPLIPLRYAPKTAEPWRVGVAMVNAFAFGGLNTCVLLGPPGPCP